MIAPQGVLLGELHSKIIISDLVDFKFFSQKFNGESPSPKFEQEHGQT